MLESDERKTTWDVLSKRDARFRPFTRLLFEAESLNRLSGFSFYRLSQGGSKKKKKRSLWYWNRWIKHGMKRDEKNDLFEIKWNVTSREIVLEVIFRILFISVRISLSIRERIIIWISRCLQSRACKMWKKELSLHLYLHSCNMDFIQRNWHVKQKLIQK